MYGEDENCANLFGLCGIKCYDAELRYIRSQAAGRKAMRCIANVAGDNADGHLAACLREEFDGVKFVGLMA